MNLFRKRNGTTTPTAADAGAPPVARNCRGCGESLESDQLACLSCGAVDAPAGGRERHWILPTTGVAAAALLLVTSASFATTTALRTGDPKAVKEQPPAVAQAIPPASGTGAAPGSATEPEDPGKGPDLGDLPDPPASDAAPPAADSKPAPPADDGSSDSGYSGGAESGGDTGSSGGSGGGYSGGSGGSGGSKPDKPEPKPVKVSEWPSGFTGYTVIVYKFNTKADARAQAREVKQAGLPAGILDSDKYESLDPGSWLVYIGQFDSAKQAEKANDKYSRAGYPGEPTFVGQTEAPESEPNNGGGGSGSGGNGSGSGGGEKPSPSPALPLP